MSDGGMGKQCVAGGIWCMLGMTMGGWGDDNVGVDEAAERIYKDKGKCRG
jgi:hypothetical protein